MDKKVWKLDPRPPPSVEKIHTFYFFFEGFPKIGWLWPKILMTFSLIIYKYFSSPSIFMKLYPVDFNFQYFISSELVNLQKTRNIVDTSPPFVQSDTDQSVSEPISYQHYMSAASPSYCVEGECTILTCQNYSTLL